MDAPAIVNQDLERAIKWSRFILQISGIWPEPGQVRRTRLAADVRVLLTFIVLLIIVILPQIAFVSKEWGDLILMTNALATLVPNIVSMVKLIVIRYHKKPLTCAVATLTEDWRRPKTVKEYDVMLWNSETSKLFTLIDYIMIAITVCLNPAFIGDGREHEINATIMRPLPLKSVYPYDSNISPYYELTVLAQMCSASVMMSTYCGANSCFNMLVMHACGQLENLRDRLEGLSMVAEDSKVSRNFRRSVAVIVEIHERVIRFVDIIEKSFNVLLLIQIVSCSILLCVQGFLLICNVSIHDDDRITTRLLLFMAAYTVWATDHMFAYCFIGDMLQTRSIEIHRAAFNCKWYNLEAKNAAYLIPIMIRAQEPLYLTAGKFCPMTLTTFSSIISSSMGYTSFLLAMKD